MKKNGLFTKPSPMKVVEVPMEFYQKDYLPSDSDTKGLGDLATVLRSLKRRQK